MDGDVWSSTWPAPTITWGALYAARGDMEAAQQEYQRAIDLDSEGFFWQRAEKALEELIGK